MKRGEKAILECAPEYAYGDAGAGGVIPPKATLMFEVEVRTILASLEHICIIAHAASHWVMGQLSVRIWDVFLARKGAVEALENIYAMVIALLCCAVIGLEGSGRKIQPSHSVAHGRRCRPVCVHARVMRKVKGLYFLYSSSHRSLLLKTREELQTAFCAQVMQLL
eukprot:COSAG02_NODE_11866_length_1639_cov_1.777922_2_plen_166_part_00